MSMCNRFSETGFNKGQFYEENFGLRTQERKKLKGLGVGGVVRGCSFNVVIR